MLGTARKGAGCHGSKSPGKSDTGGCPLPKSGGMFAINFVRKSIFGQHQVCGQRWPGGGHQGIYERFVSCIVRDWGEGNLH